MELESIYVSYRPLLVSIAYRMLGTIAEAEDVVQDAFVSVSGLDEAGVTNMKAYLSKIVTNRCLDKLKSARAKRETYIGPWLPEPLVADRKNKDPLDEVVLEESLSYAFLVMIERLNPLERAVFVLREAFGFEYAEVADMVGRTEAACRKMISRVRGKLEGAGEPEAGDYDEREQLVKSFVNATMTGDVSRLVSLLTNDAQLVSDGGGKVRAALRPIVSPDRVAAFFTGIASKAGFPSEVSFVAVNGQPALSIGGEDWPYAIICFEWSGDKIRTVYMIRNPDKLNGASLLI